MTPDRRRELAQTANAALAALTAGQTPDRAGLDALDAIVLHWASSAAMLDAVDAGYRVRWEDTTGAQLNGYTVRDRDNQIVSFGHGVQRNAWLAAVAHLRDTGRPA